MNDGGQGEKRGPLEDTWRIPREQQLSPLFQVAGSNGQSSPPCPPGKASLLFICAFTPLFSEGERIQLDITQSTLHAGKGDVQSIGFPAQTLWRCLFLASSGVWMRFLSVSSVGRPSQGGISAGHQSVSCMDSREAEPLELFPSQSLSTRAQA